MDLALSLALGNSRPLKVAFADVFGPSLMIVQTDIGARISSGVYDQLDDLSGSGNNLSQTSTSRPAVSAGINGIAGAAFDGVLQFLQSALLLPAPGTRPILIWAVVKQISWTAIAPVMKDIDGSFQLRQAGASPNLRMLNGGSGPLNSGLAIGSFGIVEQYYSNSLADYIRCGSSAALNGTNCGNANGTIGFAVGGGGGGLSNIELMALVIKADLNLAAAQAVCASARSAAQTKYGPALSA